MFYNNKKMSKNVIRVKHLDYGFVNFTNPTARQREVLEVYQEHIRDLEEVKKYLDGEVEKEK